MSFVHLAQGLIFSYLNGIYFIHKFGIFHSTLITNQTSADIIFQVEIAGIWLISIIIFCFKTTYAYKTKISFRTEVTNI